MNRLIILIGLLALFSHQIFAQFNEDSFLYTGIKLGLNYSKFVGNDRPGKNLSTIPECAVGGFLSYKFDCIFSVQQEIYLIGKLWQ